MRVPSGRVRRAVRTASITIGAVVMLAVSACAPPPAAEAVDLFEGGTYPVEIVVAPQTVTTEFSLFGLVSCTSTSVTPSVDVRGTLTVAPAELDPAITRVTIPGASLDLPGATVSAGSLSLSCDDTVLGTIGVSLQFDAAAAVRSVVLDTEAGTFATGGAHDTWDQLPDIRTEVLVIAGAMQPMQPSMIAERVADRLPNGRYLQRDDLDHFGPMTHPGEIADIVAMDLAR